VVAQQASGGMRLAAYVSPQAGAALSAQALKAALGAALPEHMVPAVCVVLDSLPLNPNGKVDRKALPKPELAGAAYAAPQGETETALALIWPAYWAWSASDGRTTSSRSAAIRCWPCRRRRGFSRNSKFQPVCLIFFRPQPSCLTHSVF
jgi:hypothetical protein